LRTLSEHEVALLVAEGVVDVLEVVDVQQEKAELLAQAVRAHHLLIDDLLKTSVVEQAGKAVRDGLANGVLVQTDVLQRESGLIGEVLHPVALAF
jgi:hypothetical protein